MIASQDRSGWFGASDTNTIFGNWTTKTFARFWLEKMGLLENDFTNIYMQAGTYYEHQILDFLCLKQRDRQILFDDLKIRVNLDGETSTTVKEVKTHSSDVFKVSLAYWRQAQVQMFATGKELDFVAYQLIEYDYKNFFNSIDANRLTIVPVEYDEHFINNQYLPIMKYLSSCLDKDITPKQKVRDSILGKGKRSA